MRSRACLWPLVGVCLVACPEADKPPGTGVEVEPEPQLHTAADAGDPRESAPTKMPVPEPESTPPADPTLPQVDPSEQGIAEYIFKRHKVLPPRATLKRVVLDFDREDEIIATVRFEPAQGRSTQWVFLLDKRGAGHAVVREWATKDLDTQIHVMGHGQGDRALIIVESQGADTSLVELLRLAPGGVLTEVARLGGTRARHGDLSLDLKHRPPLVALKKGSGVRRFEIRTRRKGFELREVTH